MDQFNLFEDQTEGEQQTFNSAETVSNSGLIIKTIIGVIVAFAVAIPNLFQGDMFLSWMYKLDGFTYFFVLIAVSAVLGFIWVTLYKTLARDHGPVINMIVFLVTSAFAGLFLGNALIVAVILIGSYAGDLDIWTVITALQITTFATLVAVIGGVIVLPKLKMDGPAIKFFRNAVILLVSLLFVSGILYLIGLLFSLLGMNFILDMYISLVYGLGPISILFSILMVIGAEALFLIVLARAKLAVGKEPKHMEYYYSIILVNAIIRIYVEIFKLVLKLLSLASRD